MIRLNGALLAIVFLLALLGLLVLPIPSSSTTRITVVVQGSTLRSSFAEEPQLAPVVINGSDQITKGTLGVIDVRDPRGTGAGWNLVVQATDFTSHNPAYTINRGSFAISKMPIVTLAGDKPPQGFRSPLDAPLKLLSAPQDTGMGHFQVKPLIELIMPASSFLETYEATLTLTLTSGP